MFNLYGPLLICASFSGQSTPIFFCIIFCLVSSVCLILSSISYFIFQYLFAYTFLSNSLFSHYCLPVKSEFPHIFLYLLSDAAGLGPRRSNGFGSFCPFRLT